MSTVKATCWSVTINNPLPVDEENIAQVRQKGWKVYGQLERGEQGTLHYQLLISTPQVRFSQVKKAFPRAHIEVARNRSALQAYVQKEDSRVESLKVDQDKYPSQLQMFQWFSSYYYQAKEIKPSVTNLEIFDLMCSQKIRSGYYIGAECMNPQIRAYIKKFGADLAHREKNKRDSLDRHPDRQARLNSQQNIINNAIASSSPLQEETSDPPSSDDEREENRNEE